MKPATLKKSATSALLGVMRDLGAFERAARSEKRRKQLLILCYHGLSIADEHEWLPKLFMKPEDFRGRLQALKEMQASVLPLGDAVSMLHAGSLPPKAVTITFDDGFYDFLAYGVPLLSEYRLPATLYLTTYYCDYRLPIVNLALNYIFWKSRRNFFDLKEQGFSEPAPIKTYDDRQAIVLKLLERFRREGLSTQEKVSVVQKIARDLNVDYEALLSRRMLQIMSREEARRTFEAGVDLQLHTHRHRTPRDRKLFEREIRDNSDCLESLSGNKPVHFCYPSGDCSPEFLPWLRELGVQTATTCERGLAKPESQDLLLPRFLDDSSVDLIRFQSFVAGFLAD